MPFYRINKRLNRKKLCRILEFHNSLRATHLSKMFVESCSTYSAPQWTTILMMLFTVYRLVNRLFHSSSVTNVCCSASFWFVEFLQRCSGNANPILDEEGRWGAKWEGGSHCVAEWSKIVYPMSGNRAKGEFSARCEERIVDYEWVYLSDALFGMKCFHMNSPRNFREPEISPQSHHVFGIIFGRTPQNNG